MHRVDTESAVATLPANQAAGTPGFFTKGDPSAPVAATKPGPDWFNTIQEELIHLVEQGGQAPDATKADRTQVYTAIAALIAAANGAQTLASLFDTTLTSPSNGDTLTYSTPAGKWINQVGASPTERLKKQLLLNTLYDAMGDEAAIRLIDAVADPFVDVSKIDAGLSSGYVHDAAGDFIHNPGTVVKNSAASEWNGATGNFTFTGDDVNGTTSSSIRSNDTLVGDFEFTCLHGASGSDFTFGFYLASEDASFNSTVADVRTLFAGCWIYNMSNSSANYGNANQATVLFDAGDDFKMTRVTGVFKIFINDVLKHTFSQTSSDPVRIIIGSEADPDLEDITWTYAGSAGDMTLVSTAFEAFAEPTTGEFVSIIEPIDAVTYGTDVLVDLSLDDGTTWEAVTIAKIDTTEEGYDVIHGKLDFATSGDQTIRYRMRGLNSKAIKVHGTIPDVTA